MTALSLDDLAALERLAKDLAERKCPSMSMRTTAVTSLISQLRAAMEVVEVARPALHRGEYFDTELESAIKAYDATTGATAP